MKVEDDKLINGSIKKMPRKNWEECFKEMKERKEDKLIIDDKVDLNMADWEW